MIICTSKTGAGCLSLNHRFGGGGVQVPWLVPRSKLQGTPVLLGNFQDKYLVKPLDSQLEGISSILRVGQKAKFSRSLSSFVKQLWTTYSSEGEGGAFCTGAQAPTALHFPSPPGMPLDGNPSFLHFEKCPYAVFTDKLLGRWIGRKPVVGLWPWLLGGKV